MKKAGLIIGTLGLAAASGCVPPTTTQQPSPLVQQQAQQQQLPPGRVYAFDSSAQAGCPGLDWHMVLGDGGALSGLIAWNNMQSVARVSGSFNLQTRAFQATATEVGGQGRTAALTGTVNPNTGWLTANIQGPNVNCQGITVPWFSPFTGGGGGR
jgi:hypothetical protein